jgi:hypothetical protein
LALSVAVEGLSTLVVGSGECGSYGHKVVQAHGSALQAEGGGGTAGRGRARTALRTALHWFYVLDEQEVVFGCREGVTAALEEMSGSGAGAILVISTCVAHVVGEDFDGLLGELEGRLDARLFHVPLPHFEGDGPEAGFIKSLEVLVPHWTRSERGKDLIRRIESAPYEEMKAAAHEVTAALAAHGSAFETPAAAKETPDAPVS